MHEDMGTWGHRDAGMQRRDFLTTTAAALALSVTRTTRAASERRFLYIAEPGIRNYVEYGGIGVLVYDIDKGYEFVRRIPTFMPAEGKPPENVKGIAANGRTGRLYVSTIGRLGCIDLTTDRLLWQKELEGGCDRMALSPDGSLLYAPSFEGPHWNVVDAASGHRLAKVVTNSGAHNTVYALDGRPAVERPLHRRPENSYRRPHGWALLERDPSVHRERGTGAVLCERQRASRVRNR